MTIAAVAEPDTEFRFAGHRIEDMLAALRHAATNEAIGLEALEAEAARHPHRVIAATIDEVRRHGIALGAAHALLDALSRHEDAVAALLRGEAE